MKIELHGPDGALVFAFPTMLMMCDAVMRAGGHDPSILLGGTYTAVAIDDNGNRLTDMEVRK